MIITQGLFVNPKPRIASFNIYIYISGSSPSSCLPWYLSDCPPIFQSTVIRFGGEHSSDILLAMTKQLRSQHLEIWKNNTVIRYRIYWSSFWNESVRLWEITKSWAIFIIYWNYFHSNFRIIKGVLSSLSYRDLSLHELIYGLTKDYYMYYLCYDALLHINWYPPDRKKNVIDREIN